MTKTNLILLVLLALLSWLSYLTWSAAGAASSGGADDASTTSKGFRTFVVDIPRERSMPRLDRVQRIIITPPRVEEQRVETAEPQDREALQGELPAIFWDMLAPRDRKALRSGESEPQWQRMPVLGLLSALRNRVWGLAFDLKRRVRGGEEYLLGEALALREAAELTQMRLARDPRTGAAGLRAFPLLEIYGYQPLWQAQVNLANIQRGRSAGASAGPVTFGELAAKRDAQLYLIQNLAGLEGLLYPWRKPFRRLERLLGGKERTGFDGFGEEDWCGEIAERLENIRALVGAEVLDHPNPREWAAKRDQVLGVLDQFAQDLPRWREAAGRIAAGRRALRDELAKMEDPARLALQRGFPPQGRPLGFQFAPQLLPRGLTPQQGLAAQGFFTRFKKLRDGEIRPFKAQLIKACRTLDPLPDLVTKLLASTPREVVLERSERGGWRLLSEGGYPASSERIDGADFVAPRLPGLSPWSAFLALLDRARNAAAELQLQRGGSRPQGGGAPLLIALADLKTSDPRGAWLPREREYGFDETALEIELQDGAGKRIDQIFLGKSPDDVGGLRNQPPWVKAREKGPRNPRDMAFVHSGKPGCRQAYRVEWSPRIVSLKPRQALRRLDFFAGFRRLIDVQSPDAMRVLLVRGPSGPTYRVQRDPANSSAGQGWSLERVDDRDRSVHLGSMDQGVARRISAELTSLYFEGVAAQVDEGDEAWKRFGFDRPSHEIHVRASGFEGRLLIGKHVRRDGELYIAATLIGGKLDGRPQERPFVHLLPHSAVERLDHALEELAGEAQLLGAGPLLKNFSPERLQRLELSESTSGEGPARALVLARRPSAAGAVRWVCPGLFDHPVDRARLENPERGLLPRLAALRRAYPFEELSDSQRASLEKNLAAGIEISLFEADGEKPAAVLRIGEDPGGAIGGARISNQRRQGEHSIARLVGEEKFFLVPALDFPDLAAEFWIDVDWRSGLAPIKKARYLRLGGAALEGVQITLAAEGPAQARVWRHEGAAQTAASEVVEELLTYVENLNPLGVEGRLEGEDPQALQQPFGEGETWLEIALRARVGEAAGEIHIALGRRQEGEKAIYLALLPGRAYLYRISPLVVDPLVAAARKLRGGG